MWDFETAYVGLVILAFLAFMVTLAYGSIVTWQVERAEKPKVAVAPEHRDAA
jgi:hypothetical protein